MHRLKNTKHIYAFEHLNIYIKKNISTLHVHVSADGSFTVPQKWGFGVGRGGVLTFMYMSIHHQL